MLEKMKDLKGFTLEALDGHIGSVEEFYFDDKHWTVRYLVVDTGSWLIGREVLISPYAISSVDKERKTISVNLTRKQIGDSPSPTSHRPVSRPFEVAYNSYYGWPSYWAGPYAWGCYPFAGLALEHWDRARDKAETEDRHLRSSKDVTGYHIQASDGEVGHVEDFVIDGESWSIRYLVIDTTNWLPGKKVLISPRWIGSIEWLEAKVYVFLTQEDIRTSPEYSETILVDREYEALLHKHYGREGYWNADQVHMRQP